jgi:hypothetical protein
MTVVAESPIVFGDRAWNCGCSSLSMKRAGPTASSACITVPSGASSCISSSATKTRRYQAMASEAPLMVRYGVAPRDSGTGWTFGICLSVV